MAGLFLQRLYSTHLLLRQAKARLQRFGGGRAICGCAHGFDHAVQVSKRQQQALNDVQPLLCLAQVMPAWHTNAPKMARQQAAQHIPMDV